MPNPERTGGEATFQLLTATSTTKSNGFAIGNPTEIGLTIPTLTTSDMTVQVAHEDVDASYTGLKDGTGTDVLKFTASSGGFSISSNDMGAVLGYEFMRLLFGTAQAANRTFTVHRKISGVQSGRG